MEIMGYIAALFIGVSLGLIGGGGSILTVPVLVYLFGISPVMATSYSLFVVGSTSLVGAIKNYKRGLVNFRTALLFGASSIATVFITRKFIIPNIPKVLFTIGGFEVTEPLMTMVVFALLMVLASYTMIKSRRISEDKTADHHVNILKVTIYGILIGVVTGLLGAGGGFLLIPTLVLIMKLPMKQAIGTSLMIIALNSLIGFTGDIGHIKMNWTFLGLITVIAIAGLYIGNGLNRKIEGQKLKKGFGWFVFAMGVYIIIKEIFFNS